MTIDEYRSKKNDKNSNYRNSLVKRTLTTFILVLIVLIVSKFSDNIKQFIKNNLLETNFQFSKINQIYQKYFGEILPDTVAVNSEVISNYNAIDYMDGAKLIVDKNYNINLLESGIVVFIGEKEGYGNTIIVQQSNGIDVWYGNVENINVTIYDYIEKGTIIGNANSEYYMVFQKNGEFLDYKNYI